MTREAQDGEVIVRVITTTQYREAMVNIELTLGAVRAAGFAPAAATLDQSAPPRTGEF
jgi:hypothetical protein